MSICIYIYMWLPVDKSSMVFSSLSNKIGGVLNLGSKLLVGLLNNSAARLGKQGSVNVDSICSKALFISVLVS